MQSESLVVPLVLKGNEDSGFIEQACVTSSPTRIISWGLHDADQEADDKPPISGAALGCDDGSVYLFSVDFTYTETSIADSSPRKHPLSLHVALATQGASVHSRSSSTSSLKTPPHSRRASQSTHAPHLLSHQPRTRAVSSVFKTSAEAPKNYVDFEDEKEKLEDMIKNGPPLKEKSIADALRSSSAFAALGLTRDDLKTDDPESRAPRDSKESSLPGGSLSISATPRDYSPSSPSRSSLSSMPTSEQPFSRRNASNSKRMGSTPRLTLRCHIFPPHFGAGHRVMSLQRLSSETLVCLQETGIVTVIAIQSGVCLASLNLQAGPCLHPPPQPCPALTSTITDHSNWSWKFLHVVETSESTILLVTACDQARDDNEDDIEPRTRVAVLQLQGLHKLSSSLESGTPARYGLLEKVGEWIMLGPPEMIGLFSEDATSLPVFFYLAPPPSSSIVFHSLQIVPSALAIAASSTSQTPSDAHTSLTNAPIASTTLPNFSDLITSPFKPKGQGDQLDQSTIPVPGRVALGPAVAMGKIPSLKGSEKEKGAEQEGDRKLIGILVWKSDANAVQGVLWNDEIFAIFENGDPGSDLRIQVFTHQGLVSFEKLSNEMIVLHQKRRIDVYRIHKSPKVTMPTLERVSFRTFSKQCQAGTAISPSLLLCSRQKVDSHGMVNHALAYVPIPAPGVRAENEQPPRGGQLKSSKAWYPPVNKLPAWRERKVTSLLPLEIELIILGYSDGSIGKSSLSDLLTTGWPAPLDNAGVSGRLMSLHSIKVKFTNENIIIGGTDDGGIAVWDLLTLRLRAWWTIFTEPLHRVISVNIVGQECAICVSFDGTLAVIAVEDLQFLYVIPGSAARLTRICLCEENLLLVYADGKARLWDIKTQVFWRSMTSDIAGELTRQGSWFQTTIDDDYHDLHGTPLVPIQKYFSSYDAASTLLFNIRALNDLIYPFPPSHLFRDPRREDSSPRVRDQGLLDGPSASKRASDRLKFLKTLLGSLLSFGLDDTIDGICREKLGITSSYAAVGLFSYDSTTVLSTMNAREAWQISPEHTASRLLALVTTLRGLLAFDEECEPYASQVITFYVASLHDVVGPLWRGPSLSFLARYWFHPSSDIRLAARALFGAAADRLSNHDTVHLVEYWQHDLPCLQPDAEKQTDHSALALLIAGNLATERYTLLAAKYANTLTDIAKSITLYLHDETCPHRGLAIDLCSRGFQIWQQYVDAVEVLRALFVLSTSAEKERNVGPQARLAVLQIASSNTPLFMTTLSLDILRPPSVQKRKSIMQLVAFLIRKKPLVLYPNLPRLVEAVVKSLDPSSSSDREAVMEDATEILGQVVKTYPSVDFHTSSQRLCVGTGEGAVIMYDLKTATRLYVLEGHKKRLDACSFSADGRRLATVSLEEGLVRVWKVGSSITSLFMPGAPPRQGHAGSEPFKTLNFNVGDEAHMTITGILESVQFEWPTERTARLKVRESVFTFST